MEPDPGPLRHDGVVGGLVVQDVGGLDHAKEADLNVENQEFPRIVESKRSRLGLLFSLNAAASPSAGDLGELSCAIRVRINTDH